MHVIRKLKTLSSNFEKALQKENNDVLLEKLKNNILEELSCFEYPNAADLLLGVQEKCVEGADFFTLNNIKCYGFLMGQGAYFQWHNHPSMHVFSLALVGELEVNLLHYKNEEKIAEFHELLNKKMKNIDDTFLNNWQITNVEMETKKFTHKQSFFLTPTLGNIHSILAVKPTLFIDIAIPYYDYSITSKLCSFFNYSNDTKILKWSHTVIDEYGQTLK